MKTLVLSSGSSWGAYQAGVMLALEELDWSPDIVLGSSVGAINAAGYAAMSAEEVAKFWMDVEDENVYRWRPLKDWFNVFQWNHLLDTTPLKKFLESRIDLKDIHQSDILTLLSGIDVRTGQQCIFSSETDDTVDPLRPYYRIEDLDHDAIMSSSAIPGIFPWVDGVWDGAFQQHNPLKPAIKMGSDEILIVHLYVPKEEKSDLPKGIIDTAWRIVELASSYHIKRDLQLLRQRNDLPEYRGIDAELICPDEPLGYSRLNFSDTFKKKRAIDKGYDKTLDVLNET